MTLLAPSPLPERLADAAAAERLFAPLAGEPVEVIAFAYLDAEQRLLGMRQSRSHARDTHAVSVRDIAIDALAWAAAGLVMAHNHPSGDSAPSQADRDATRRIARALEPLGVRLLDHLIIVPGGATSFRALGLL